MEEINFIVFFRNMYEEFLDKNLAGQLNWKKETGDYLSFNSFLQFSSA